MSHAGVLINTFTVAKDPEQKILERLRAMARAAELGLQQRSHVQRALVRIEGSGNEPVIRVACCVDAGAVAADVTAAIEQVLVPGLERDLGVRFAQRRLSVVSPRAQRARAA